MYSISIPLPALHTSHTDTVHNSSASILGILINVVFCCSCWVLFACLSPSLGSIPSSQHFTFSLGIYRSLVLQWFYKKKTKDKGQKNVMTSRSLLALALAASSVASVLPRTANPGFLSFPIAHKTSVAPLVKRDGDVPLFNVSSTSYLVECEYALGWANLDARLTKAVYSKRWNSWTNCKGRHRYRLRRALGRPELQQQDNHTAAGG